MEKKILKPMDKKTRMYLAFLVMSSGVIIIVVAYMLIKMYKAGIL